jgi:hypothetical protein
MSFYLDSDNDDDDNDNDIAPKFTCPNCGSSNSYQDDAGNLYCSACFSQSQTQPNEADFDFEDLHAIAARNRSGQFISHQPGNQNHRKRCIRKPLEMYDTSQPLPSLEECLSAYTTILRKSIKCVSEILGLNNSQSYTIEMAIRQVWLEYLKTWQEGSEFYQKYHPEMKFSLRDSFIFCPGFKSSIFKYFTNKIAEKIDKEKEEGSEGHVSSEDTDTHIASDKEAVQGKKMKFNAILSQMLKVYNRKGKLEAALYLRPRMSLIASLLLTALCKLGVAAPHIVKWISTGKIPLLNAYSVVLSEDEKLKMRLIPFSFRLNQLPSSKMVEYKAKLLMIVAGQKPQLVPPNSVPLLTARLVSDLHLEQRILVYALALLGKNPPAQEDEWLPRPLEALQNVKSRVSVLAAIAVACKLTPGLEKRKYRWDHGADIPWNEDQIDFVRDPISYLQFVNKHILADRTEEETKVKPCFLPNIDHSDVLSEDEKSLTSKGIPPIMAGLSNPNQPEMTRLQKYHEWRLQLRKRKAVWADANGVESYIVYPHHSKLSNLHPHYQILLETMALLADVKASNIHLMVCTLDREIWRTCRAYETHGGKRIKRRAKTERKATNSNIISPESVSDDESSSSSHSSSSNS